MCVCVCVCDLCVWVCGCVCVCVCVCMCDIENPTDRKSVGFAMIAMVVLNKGLGVSSIDEEESKIDTKPSGPIDFQPL